jgi:hypothetical protein
MACAEVLRIQGYAMLKIRSRKKIMFSNDIMYFKSMEREKFAAAHSTAIKALEMCF